MTDQHENGAIPPIGSASSTDRGAPNVKGRKSGNKPLILAGAVVVALVATGVGVTLYKHRDRTVTIDEPKQDGALIKNTAKDKGVSSDMAEITTEDMKIAEANKKAQERAAKEALMKPAGAVGGQSSGTTSGGLPPPPQSSAGRTDKNAPPTPAQRRLMGETLVEIKVDKNADTPAKEGGMNDALTGETYAAGSTSLRDNSDYLLSHGTFIPCVLKTKIVTTYKGLVVCQLTKDVYSVNGKTLLMEKGSSIFGEQKVALAQGQARVFLNWTSVDTPLGVKARIDSLGTDALGASGAEAWVDNHFAERFGGAIMLSFIDDALAAASQRVSSNGDVTFDNSTKNASDMASKALENSINIPPTAYVNQGELMNVLIARDVDFSGIYQNRKP